MSAGKDNIPNFYRNFKAFRDNFPDFSDKTKNKDNNDSRRTDSKRHRRATPRGSRIKREQPPPGENP